MFSVLANIGGTMGVCIGGSILTLVEFAEFLILKITYYLVSWKGKRYNLSSTPVKNFDNT